MLGVAFLITIIGFVSVKRRGAVCTKITVKIKDSTGEHLIDENEILGLIERPGANVINKPVDEINIAKIEKRVDAYSFVKHAEVYIDIDGEMIAEIAPRIPVVRVCNRLNQQYYIDNEGCLMPASINHPVRLLVANGNISHKPRFDTVFSIYNKKFDKRIDIKTLRDIHTLASFIKSKPFWNAQIQQIYVNNDDEIELSPLVGDQNIVLGPVDNLEDKFRKLEAFYKKGMPVSGWNTYKEINLKYKNQVVCVKRD